MLILAGIFGAVIIGIAVVFFFIMKLMLILVAVAVGALYGCIALGLYFLLGPDQLGWVIFGALALGTLALFIISAISGDGEARSKTSSVGQGFPMPYTEQQRKLGPCPCGSGKAFTNCHGKE